MDQKHGTRNGKPRGGRKRMKGIIISEDTFSDERIKLIESMPNGDETLIIFFRLLSLACKSNAGGFLLLTREIPYNDEMLAAIFGRSLQSVKFALTTLQQFGMIRESEEGFQVENFLDWMAPEDKAREQARIRMQKHREVKKELPAPSSEEEPKKKAKTRKLREYAEDSLEMSLAKYLLKKINEHSPDYPPPSNWNRWADDMRLIMERKNKTPEQIRNLINWIHNPNNFWCDQILSAGKLKEKYNDLAVKANKEFRQNQLKPKGAQAQKDDVFDKLLNKEVKTIE